MNLNLLAVQKEKSRITQIHDHKCPDCFNKSFIRDTVSIILESWSTNYLHRNLYSTESLSAPLNCFLPGISRCSRRPSCTSHILPTFLFYKRKKKAGFVADVLKQTLYALKVTDRASHILTFPDQDTQKQCLNLSHQSSEDSGLSIFMTVSSCLSV